MWNWLKSKVSLAWQGIKNFSRWIGTKVGLVSPLPPTTQTPAESSNVPSSTYAKLTGGAINNLDNPVPSATDVSTFDVFIRTKKYNHLVAIAVTQHETVGSVLEKFKKAENITAADAKLTFLYEDKVLKLDNTLAHYGIKQHNSILVFSHQVAKITNSNPDVENFDIFIKAFDLKTQKEKHVMLNVKPTENVGRIMKRFMEVEGITADDYRLGFAYAGRHLGLFDTLDQINAKKESTLHQYHMGMGRFKPAEILAFVACLDASEAASLDSRVRPVDTMQIFFRSLKGECVTVDVTPSETIGSAMKKFLDHESITNKDFAFRLVYAGKHLNINDTLVSSGIVKECTIHVVVAFGRGDTLDDVVGHLENLNKATKSRISK